MPEIDKDKAVDLLNRILEYELAGVVRYTHYSLLQQTARRLRRVDGAPSSSWPAHASHPRLAVLMQKKAWMAARSLCPSLTG